MLYHNSKVAVEILSNINILDNTILEDKAYNANEILNYI